MNRNFFRILNDNFDKYSDNILIEEDKGKSWTYHDVKQLTFHFSSFLKKLGLKENTLVGFSPNSKFEFIIDKERLYRVLTNSISIKYEYQGQEKEYNPSWL